MRLLTLLLTALALALVACGGDDEETTPAPAATTEETTEDTGTTGGASGALTLKADEQELKFDKDELTAPAGTVTIKMENPSATPHNVGIKGGDVSELGEVVTKGGTSEVSADLEAGTYTFYCSVAGHEAGGMKGTLTVE